MTTTDCPRCGRTVNLPLTWRTRPTHDRDGRLVIVVTMPAQYHRCPKETPK